MITYKASEDLVQIFLKNGFSDITVRHYPEHVKRIDKDGYNPNQQKRALAINKNSKNTVVFDYISITPYFHGGCASSDIRLEVTEDELKSIITFYKLPTHDQTTYVRLNGRITDIHSRYKRICESPRAYKKKSAETLKNIFENVTL
jgi:hypothetical protein